MGVVRTPRGSHLDRVSRRRARLPWEYLTSKNKDKIRLETTESGTCMFWETRH